MKECTFEPQSVLVKNYEKLNHCIISESDEVVFLTMDGFVGYVIPKQYWILGKLKFAPSTTKVEHFIGDERDYVPAKITGTVITTAGNELLVLESEREPVYLNPKLLKKSFPKNVRLMVTKRTAPVRVYDGEILLGIILPVNYKG